MPGDAWPDWNKIADIVQRDNYMSGNAEFTKFKKMVMKVSDEEIDAESAHAPVMWEFLIGFAAQKSMYRKLIVQIFNRLTTVPSWVAAWEAQVELHEKLKSLHEELQAALGVQHEAIANSISVAAKASMAHVGA
eukprot:6280623-Amphidinium_carterae.1